MARFLKPKKDPDQRCLLPANIEDELTEDHEVCKLKWVMKKLDYSRLESTYSLEGRPAYPPDVMMRILVYSSIEGTRSSRRIEACCKYDMRYIWLCDGFRPDHNTIARFLKNGSKILTDLFAQTLLLCVREGLVSARCIAVDGSKFEANASKKSMFGKEEIESARKAAARMLAEAKAIDEAESEANREAKEELIKKAETCERKASQAEKLLEETGKKKVSLSDTESRTMKTGSGIRSSYNVQMAVDTSSGVILSAFVTNAENDHRQLPQTLQNIEKVLGKYPELVLADTGYSDDVNFGFMRENGINALIPVQVHKTDKTKEDDPFCTKNFTYNKERDVMVCPAGKDLAFKAIRSHSQGRLYREYVKTGCKGCEHCADCCRTEPSSRRRIYLSVEHEYRDDMTQRMSLEENKRLFAKRKETIEPTFGDFKNNRNFRRFSLRGLEGVTCETLLMCIAHNLRKLVCCASFRLFLPLLRARLSPKYRAQDLQMRFQCPFGFLTGFGPKFGFQPVSKWAQ